MSATKISSTKRRQALVEFDQTYQTLIHALDLKALLIHNPMHAIKLKTYDDGNICQVQIHGPFWAIFHPPVGSGFAIQGMPNHRLFFNGYPLNQSNVGLTNASFPCVLFHLANSVCEFIVFKHPNLSPKLALISSTTMTLEVEPKDSASSDWLAHGNYLLKTILNSKPPMGPDNEIGRSRQPRKYPLSMLVREMIEGNTSQHALMSTSTRYQVSERTLRNSFKLATGLTPKQFELEYLLHRFRQAIIQNPDQTIEHVCQQLNIAQWGRFSHRYHQRFLENPSNTKRTYLALKANK